MTREQIEQEGKRRVENQFNDNWEKSIFRAGFEAGAGFRQNEINVLKSERDLFSCLLRQSVDIALEYISEKKKQTDDLLDVLEYIHRREMLQSSSISHDICQKIKETLKKYES